MGQYTKFRSAGFQGLFGLHLIIYGLKQCSHFTSLRKTSHLGETDGEMTCENSKSDHLTIDVEREIEAEVTAHTGDSLGRG